MSKTFVLTAAETRAIAAALNYDIEVADSILGAYAIDPSLASEEDITRTRDLWHAARAALAKIQPAPHLDPHLKVDQAINRLLAVGLGRPSEDQRDRLDDLVRDVHDSQAANINNCGPEEQARFLLENGINEDVLLSILNPGQADDR